MELRHLRYFVAAAETENVSRAALKLHVSQPALSRQIKDLEEELGFPLFERGAKSVRLTDGGRAFLSEARAVLQRAEQAVSAARAVATGGSGELHLGYAPSPTVRILPPSLREFQARMPKVRVKLHDMSTQEMLAGVSDGKLQMAFVVKPSRSMLRGLQFEELVRDQMCLAVPPGHRLASSRTLSLTAAAKEPLVIFSRKEYPEYHEYLEAEFARIRAKPQIAEEHDGSASMIAAIESGAGVAIVPLSFSCSSGPRLHLVPLAPQPEPLVIGAVWVPAGLTLAAKAFLNAARDAVKNLQPLSSGERTKAKRAY